MQFLSPRVGDPNQKLTTLCTFVPFSQIRFAAHLLQCECSLLSSPPPLSPPLSSPPLPSPPLGSLYLYPFQSEGSQSVSDLSSLIPTFKPPALKSLFDITGELGFPPLYLSAGEDPPKSHLALLGKHSPPLLLLRNTLRALLDVWGVSFQIFLLQIAAWKLSAIFGPFT